MNIFAERVFTDMTSYDNEKFIALIKERLSPYRFYHSLCVADSAKSLAERYSADAEKAYTAGILHDAMKEAPISEQLEMIKKAGMDMTELEMMSNKFYHQKSGAAFAELVCNIKDKEILSAIRYHTTGRADMTLMEEILYLADFISADRDYDDVDIMREKTEKSKEEGLLYAASYSIISVVKSGKILHPDTVYAYNSFIKKYFS